MIEKVPNPEILAKFGMPIQAFKMRKASGLRGFRNLFHKKFALRKDRLRGIWGVDVHLRHTWHLKAKYTPVKLIDITLHWHGFSFGFMNLYLDINVDKKFYQSKKWREWLEK